MGAEPWRLGFFVPSVKARSSIKGVPLPKNKPTQKSKVSPTAELEAPLFPEKWAEFRKKLLKKPSVSFPSVSSSVSIYIYRYRHRRQETLANIIEYK